MKRLDILIVTPAAPGTRHGNRHTAVRWARHLAALGHRVSITVEWDGRPHDLMIALHARRSHASLARWTRELPGRPLILALTGTDLYRDIRIDASARESMALADRMIVLQEEGLAELAPALRRKTRVVTQSVQTPARARPPQRSFLVTVLGHLREEKDPFRAAEALRHLPAESRIRVVHLGGAMSPAFETEARERMRREPRYRWLGELPHARAMRWLARSHAMVISSRMEGGAHVVSEAIALGVPVIASDIPGNVGLLGRDYPACYPVEDDRALARLLARAEAEPAFLAQLERGVKSRRALVRPATERRGLQALVAELTARASGR